MSLKILEFYNVDLVPLLQICRKSLTRSQCVYIFLFVLIVALFFFFVRKCYVMVLPDTAGNRTLRDDGSIFQTLLPCLQVPEGEIGPFISLLLIV